MAEIIYILCALFSACCAYLLFRHADPAGSRLIFWSGVCFGGLALQNVMLVIDLVMLPEVELVIWRTALALLAMAALLFAFVWETH